MRAPRAVDLDEQPALAVAPRSGERVAALEGAVAARRPSGDRAGRGEHVGCHDDRLICAPARPRARGAARRRATRRGRAPEAPPHDGRARAGSARRSRPRPGVRWSSVAARSARSAHRPRCGRAARHATRPGGSRLRSAMASTVSSGRTGAGRTASSNERRSAAPIAAPSRADSKISRAAVTVAREVGSPGRLVVGVDAEGQRRAQPRVVCSLREQVLEQVVAGRRADADREVDGCASERHRRVDPSAWQVQHVARLEHRVDRRLGLRAQGDAVAVLGPGLGSERMPVDGFVDRPPLRAGDLDHEDVVRVEVRIEAARRRRGDVGVDLRGVAEVGDQPSSEGGDRLPRAVKALQHQRGTAGELLENLRRIQLVAHLGAEAARAREQRRGQDSAFRGHAHERRPQARGRRPARRPQER